MTETTAKSGGSGTSTTPVDEEPTKDGSAPAGREAAGRSAAADAPSQPKFTRAPGMAPPPGEPPADAEKPTEVKRTPAPASAPAPAPAPPAPATAKGSASVPVVTKGKGAAPTVTGRTTVTPPNKPGTAPQRPAGPNTPPRPAQAAAGQARPAAAEALKRTAAGAAAVGAARVSEAVRSARSTVASAAGRGPRRARLNLKRIDPWSVMKFSFAVSVVLFIVLVVATSVLYLALDAMGVWGSLNKILSDLVSNSGGADATGSAPLRVTAWGVIGTSMLIGAVNVVLFTALATLSAFIYNVCADLVGGIELTLAERD